MKPIDHFLLAFAFTTFLWWTAPTREYAKRMNSDLEKLDRAAAKATEVTFEDVLKAYRND